MKMPSLVLDTEFSFAPFASPLAILRRKLWTLEERFYAVGQSLDVTRLIQQACFPIENCFRDPAQTRGDHGQPTCGHLKGSTRERVPPS